MIPTFRLCNVRLTSRDALIERASPNHRNRHPQETSMQVIDSKNILEQIRKGPKTLPALLACLAWCPAAFLLLVFLALPAHAQYRTSIQGQVTDPQGAVIPGETLMLKNQATNETVIRKSVEVGIFNCNALPGGRCTWTVERRWFKTKVLNYLQLIPEQPNPRNIQL